MAPFAFKLRQPGGAGIGAATRILFSSIQDQQGIKSMMLKKSVYILLAATLGTVALPSGAASSEAGATARSGVLRCGGNHILRLGGTEAHSTSYAVRNFDSENGITLNRMRVFNGLGQVLFDSAFSPLPSSVNGILGPGNNVLGPNQSTYWNSFSFVPNFLPDSQAPLQLEIEWSAPQRVITLDAITVRIVHRRDPTTFAILEERGRHAIDCRPIQLR